MSVKLALLGGLRLITVLLHIRPFPIFSRFLIIWVEDPRRHERITVHWLRWMI